jgi:hypothetical protein
MLHSAAKARLKNFGWRRHHPTILNGRKYSRSGWWVTMELFEETDMEHIMKPSTSRQRESIRDRSDEFLDLKRSIEARRQLSVLASW